MGLVSKLMTKYRSSPVIAKAHEGPDVASDSALAPTSSPTPLSSLDVASQGSSHDGLTSIPLDFTVSEEQFTAALHASDTYREGSLGRREYIDGSTQRLYRIFASLYPVRARLAGPTLDVASGWGLMYPAYRQFLPALLPYCIAEMEGWEVTIDGDRIDGCKFECERDTLRYPDNHFGLLSFFDCIEHLIVDPLWPLLEFNRVLKPGGTIAISTPNAAAAYKIFQIALGNNPATEANIKPSAIYQRHNRERTPLELRWALECCGFANFRYSTNPQLLQQHEVELLQNLQSKGYLGKPLQYFGPELFVVAEKTRHVTLQMDLPKDIRWPDWLYSTVDAYRKRPKVFPIVVSDDYA